MLKDIWRLIERASNSIRPVAILLGFFGSLLAIYNYLTDEEDTAI